MNALDEMTIAENGPSIFKADKLLSNAMETYWRDASKSGEWHFLKKRTSQKFGFGQNRVTGPQE